MAFLGSRSAFAGAFVALAIASAGSGQSAGEYEVKAAFLYNFTRFVEWPSAPRGAPFCIGVEEPDPFHGALENILSGRTAGARAIALRRLMKPENAAGCEIVFIPGADPGRLRAALSPLQGIPALTVGEAPGFCQLGGIVEFSVEDRKVRLTINLDAAARARLQISSKLLSLASVVHDGAAGGGRR